MVKVMIVDDEEHIREGLKMLLEQIITGYDVIALAVHGEEALKRLKCAMPDVVITDIRMPIMDGIALCKQLSTDYPQLPVVIISGHEEFQYAREALKIGVKDYLLKPIDRVELALTLKKLTQTETEEDDHIISKIQSYIVKNLNADLTLQSLSVQFHLHPTYISQLYKKHTNQNLNDYILEQRMQKATKLLKESKLKVYDIAALVGYINSTHFTTVFKQYTGMTPKEYRMTSSLDYERNIKNIKF